MNNIDNEQLERYSRQIIINKLGIKGQKKIFNTSVCIIGCGGLGTSAAQYLVMSGIQKLILIDNDKISLSNLNRQTLFFEEDIGKSKVEVLKKNLLKINSLAKIKVFKKKISSKNISLLTSNYKIILDCTDNFKSRYVINKFCSNKKKILIGAALQNFDLQAFAFAPWKRNNFPCYNCIFPNQHSSTTEQSCDSMGIIAPVAGLGGVLQAVTTIKTIISPSLNIFKELIIFDTFNSNFIKIKIAKNSKCKVCKT